ncbi:hypothetical protein ACFYZI_33885 [Streptomyces griseorubiginosus]|uniref:hypothetical protein n=1 Tax=Streptomyces griseorubiginosus TaxID=67304 RepID=UPI0036C750C8
MTAFIGVLARRERYGFTYLTVLEASMEAFAPRAGTGGAVGGGVRMVEFRVPCRLA